jgi:hypothetical protein
VDRATVFLAGGLAAALGAVHLVAGKIRFLRVIPRSRWLSASSGVSVAYVFVHILPDLAEGQRTLREVTGGPTGFAEHHVYLLALLGMMIFYGLERLAKESRRARRADTADHDDVTSPGVFWLHAGSFSLYNALIGYLLLHREVPGRQSLVLFGLAMATHFLVNDYGLREDHKWRYDRLGRWILAAAVLVGYATGLLVEVHRAAVAALFAFLAGGVVLNVLKEELPEERQSNFWAFAAGAAAYAGLLIAV